MGLLATARQRLSDLSSPQKPALPKPPLDATPPPNSQETTFGRRSLLEQSRQQPHTAFRAKGEPQAQRLPLHAAGDHRVRQLRQDSQCLSLRASDECAAARHLEHPTRRDPSDHRSFPASESGPTARVEVFETDEVQWAGYLMEGSVADERDSERARLFVQEGLEIMHSVDEARAEVDRVCAL